MSQLELEDDPIRSTPIITDADLLEARRKREMEEDYEEACRHDGEAPAAIQHRPSDGPAVVPETPPHHMGVIPPIRKHPRREKKLYRKNRLAYHLRFCSGFDCTNKIYFNKKCPPYRTLTVDIPMTAFRALFTGEDQPHIYSEVQPKGHNSLQLYFCSDYCWTQAKIQKPDSQAPFRASVLQ